MEGLGKKLVALHIVINAGFADEVMNIAREAGAKGATIVNARGEGPLHKSILGITVDSEKEIVIMLIEADTAENIMTAIKEQAGLNFPSQGVCFTIPIDKTTLVNNFDA